MKCDVDLSVIVLSVAITVIPSAADEAVLFLSLIVGTVLWSMKSLHGMELKCCMKVLVNGSVSYTLNRVIPNSAITSWTKNVCELVHAC